MLDIHEFGSYPYNYWESSIRSWLNSDFYNAAFSLDSSYIQTTEVDNSPLKTNSSSNPYENTNDKVYLLSYQDYKNESYFPDNESRRCDITDYAKASGADCDSHYQDSGPYYWTRSKQSDYPFVPYIVASEGNIRYLQHFGYGWICVRPAITIKM